jgi:MFS family permease
MLKKWTPLFRNRDFLLALGGRGFSALGDEMAIITLTLRIEGHGSPPYMVALLFAAGSVPWVAFGGWAGRLADRTDSRLLLVTSAATATAFSLPLIVVHSVPAILALLAVLGASTAVSQATWSALTPRVVGEADVGRAASVTQAAFSGSLLIGPTLAGLLTAGFGTRLPLLVDACSFGVLAFAALGVRTRRGPARLAPEIRMEEMRRSGLAIIREDPLLLVLTGTLALFILLGSMSNVVIVFLVRRTLHAGPAWYGFVEGAWGLGLTLGSLGAGLVYTDKARARVAMLGATAMGGATLAYGFVPAVSPLGALALLGGIGNGLLNALVSTILATRVPERRRGRAFAALNAVTSATGIGSLAAGGLVASILPPREVMLLAGASGLVVGMVGALRVGKSFRSDDPSSQAPLSPRSS